MFQHLLKYQLGTELIYLFPFHNNLKHMPSRQSTQKASAHGGIRDDIPAEVRAELAQVGGLEGLCSQLPSQEFLESETRMHHALSDPVRLKILHLLQVQPLCVCVIKQCIRIADSKLSYHLNILKESGLIEGRTEKNWIIYRLTDTGRTTGSGDPGMTTRIASRYPGQCRDNNEMDKTTGRRIP
jgi:ArsR family transcriptional regulator, arsenate/arsenite/antimonite-responsive transcriptional repressor